MADSIAGPLPRRPRRLALGGAVGVGTSAMRTSGDDIAEVPCAAWCPPIWDDALTPGCRFEAMTLRSSAARASTSRWDLRLLPRRIPACCHDAGRRHYRSSRVSTIIRTSFLRAHATADLAVHGDQRRSTDRDFRVEARAYWVRGSCPLIDGRNWRTTTIWRRCTPLGWIRLWA